MMRRVHGAAAGLAALAFAAGAICAATPPAGAAAKIVQPAGETLQVAVSKGIILRLDRPVANVFVADPEVADIQVKSPTVIYVVGKTVGETTLFAVDRDDAVLVNSRVSVSEDPDRLRRTLKQVGPGSAVQVTPLDNSLVLQGTVRSASEAENARRLAERILPEGGRVVSQMQVDAPNQINLRVRIAEVSRNVFKSIGLNWQAMFGTSNTLIGLATGAPVLDAAGNFLTGAPVTSPSGAIASTFNNLVARAHSGRVDVHSLIDALEQQGLVTVLAEPNLTAVSGRPASFLAGGEFPVPVPQTSSGGGVPTITVQYKQFGVSLKFLATILARDRISLDVEPEVSQLSSTGAVQISGITIPALTTRRAQTTVELGSGESFAIAGLLQNDVLQRLSKVPWLGEVPVLGALFRSTDFERDESELVIIVTPYIVKPVAVAQLPVPNDGFRAPSDGSRVIEGSLNRVPPTRGGAAPGATLGFEID